MSTPPAPQHPLRRWTYYKEHPDLPNAGYECERIERQYPWLVKKSKSRASEEKSEEKSEESGRGVKEGILGRIFGWMIGRRG